MEGNPEVSWSSCVRVSRKKFYVIVAGKTNGAHIEIVEKLRGRGQIEVSSPEDSDYLVVFCPIASRVGTDIGEALQTIEGGKPIILVVMHHTFSPDHVVADSRRQVDKPDVHLTVDCLFHEGRFLRCDHNEIAWSEIQRFLGVPVAVWSTWEHVVCQNKSESVHTHREELSCVSVRHTEMPETLQTEYQSISNMDQEVARVSWKKFYVTVAGNTNGAHNKIVEKLLGIGQIEVSSPEDSDYLVVFCPISTRVRMDIRETLECIEGDKPIILVVMHHTFNPDYVVADSKSLVDNPNVHLTVDCFFYEGKLLSCDRNEIAWSEIQRLLGVPVSELAFSQPSFLQSIIGVWENNNWKQIPFDSYQPQLPYWLRKWF
ncbi:uncharacterized protein ABDE67_017045 isoform 2-T2 [Symphorus nematophorus]